VLATWNPSPGPVMGYTVEKDGWETGTFNVSSIASIM
jgi:hypothetical protein